MGVKKLIFRFKNWLIEKLGGHTDEEVMALSQQLSVVHKYNFQPIILRTETGYSAWQLGQLSDAEVRSKFVAEMMDQFGKELLERGLVRISYADYLPACIRTYRAELVVISPEDWRNATLQMENEFGL